ncbi:MAG: hypothetical protein NUV86_05360 [Candidatus Scalindua sp.]|nr:hypothetical protein [Candidatus Scalindua sp.]
MKLTAKQARDLAQSFRTVSVSLGEYRFANWDSLTKAQRDTIEDAEWTLLNYSSDFVTQAVGLTLDDAKGSLKNIQDATAKAQKAVETIKTTKKVVVIVGAVIKLGAAIVSENPGLIASATGDLFNAVTAKDN